MDLGDSDGGFDAGLGGLPPKKRDLPADLPRSLDDRRHVPTELVRETELYDGWQGECLVPHSFGFFGVAWPLLTCLGSSQGNHSS